MYLKDIPFTPNVPIAVYEAAKKWLVDTKSSHRNNGNYCIFSSNGRSHENIGTQCHFAISTPNYSDRCCVATEIGLHRKKREANPNVLAFLDWFLYRSPYSQYILNRNDFAFCRDYGIIVSADVTTQVLQNIMIMSRHFHEIDTQSFDMFVKLVSEGVPESIAYPVCFNTYWSSNGTKENMAVGSVHGHRAHPLFNLGAWRNYHAGRIGGMFSQKWDMADPKTHYRNNNNFTGGIFLFHEPFKGSGYEYDTGQNHFVFELMQLPDFRSALSDYRKSTTQGAVYKPPNPFKRDPLAPTLPANQVTYKEFFEFVTPWVAKSGLLFDSVEEERKVSNG